MDEILTTSFPEEVDESPKDSILTTNFTEDPIEEIVEPQESIEPIQEPIQEPIKILPIKEIYEVKDSPKLKANKPRSTPVKSSSSTPNFKKLIIPEFKPMPKMDESPKIEVSSKVSPKLKKSIPKTEVTSFESKPEVLPSIESKPNIKTEVLTSVTSNPVTPKPVTSKPVVSNSVSPKPVVSNSVTSKPVTSNPDVIKTASKPDVKTPKTVPTPKTVKATFDEPKKYKPKIPNYSEMSIEEQAKHRSTFLARFSLLRDSWKSHNIPEIKDSMSLEEIHDIYDIYVKNIHVSQSKDKYKVYMVVMWLFIEYACIKMGLNVSGYTMAQMKSMTKYERLLIELGEKNYQYSPAGEANDWPVELNIVFMALANAAIFIVIKMLCESMKMGDALANTIVETISSYLSGDQPQPGNVLFGGQHHTGSEMPDVPQNNMGGLDVVNLISHVGNMFLQSQKPVDMTQGKTPKFKPAYEE